MNDRSRTTSQPAATIPPDDPQRKLTLARPDEDKKLPHISVAGDTYTILVSGEDTAGRYCLIDMHIPAAIRDAVTSLLRIHGLSKKYLPRVGRNPSITL